MEILLKSISINVLSILTICCLIYLLNRCRLQDKYINKLSNDNWTKKNIIEEFEMEVKFLKRKNNDLEDKIQFMYDSMEEE